jgi:hypothetical protein
MNAGSADLTSSSFLKLPPHWELMRARFFIVSILRAEGSGLVPRPKTILDRWSIGAEELTAIVDENPSLRGMLLGYVAEFKLEELLRRQSAVTDSFKHDDHDRRGKGDRVITYKGNQVIVEVKSLQTNSVRKDGETWIGKAQVDASDRRRLKLPDKSTVETTCLQVGEFDLLAVNLYAFEEEWRFVFAHNRDLPRSTFSRYTERQRRYLLATLVEVTWPPRPPFREDPLPLLEEIVRERKP